MSIVLAMHGATPNDLTEAERVAYFRLRAQLNASTLADQAAVHIEYDALDAKIRNWPRTRQGGCGVDESGLQSSGALNMK